MSNQPAVLGPDGVARPYIGGQALIEGVMMRSPHCFSAVVRRKSGALVVREMPMADLRRGKLAWPLVRGVAALVEALKLGSTALRFSAEQFEQDLEDDGEPKSAPRSKPSTLALLSLPIIALLTNAPEDFGKGPKAAPSEGDGKKRLLGVLSAVFAIGMFVALPQAFAAGASSVFGLGLDVRDVRFQLLTAGAKLTILIGYMLLIRRMPEIYRVFQYHGAEHKSIYTYESGQALTVENARPKTTLHPRCGTTFIVMVALVSILVFSALGPLLPQLGLGKLADNLLFFAFKLPFLPFIAAITFELQRVLAKYCTKGPGQVLLWPGFLVQKITTIEPDDKQLEVALSALLVTLEREQQGAAPEVASERTFDDFSTLTRGAVQAA
ncbi:MAG TPA: DUF1385 domain-containing protein [Polyangiaceae bacterium]|jgi:uncharacterized protein YqhQ|nr:DUF1385 domain-containing protein [Polyangiaceae bacterium]